MNRILPIIAVMSGLAVFGSSNSSIGQQAAAPLATGASMGQMSQEQASAQKVDRSENVAYRIGAAPSTLEAFDPATGLTLKRCTVGSKVSEAKLTFDNKAVITSDSEYVLLNDINRCSKEPVPAHKASDTAGFLVDVNAEHNIYMALLAVSTQPMSFVATVARVGSDMNLMSLPGAYVNGTSMEALTESAFAYSGDEPRPKISPDGRYATPDGSIDCTENAYPGVWDLQRNKRVVFSETEPGDGSSSSLCMALFGLDETNLRGP